MFSCDRGKLTICFFYLPQNTTETGKSRAISKRQRVPEVPFTHIKQVGKNLRIVVYYGIVTGWKVNSVVLWYVGHIIFNREK